MCDWQSRLLERAEVAHVALGAVADVADWYEQVRITVAADGAGGRVVRVTGELASGTAAYLDVVLEHEVAARPTRLVVDLSAVSFLGVRGVAVLVAVADRARRGSLALVVDVGNRPDLTRALQRALGPGTRALYASPKFCSHVLEPHLGSPRRARVLVRRACLDWSLGNAYDDAALVVTELVTNAVRHTGTPCRLTICLDGDGLRLAVRDQGPLPPALLDQDLRWCGAGLRVVTTLTPHWGVVPHVDGKTVWARFPSRPAHSDVS